MMITSILSVVIDTPINDNRKIFPSILLKTCFLVVDGRVWIFDKRWYGIYNQHPPHHMVIGPHLVMVGTDIVFIN